MDKGDDLLQSNVVFVVLMLPVPLFYIWLGAPTGNSVERDDVWTTGVGVSLCRVRQSCSCWRLKRQHRLLSPLLSINSHDNKYSAAEKDLLKCCEYLYLDLSPSCKKLDYSLTNHGEKCLPRSQTWDKKERDLKRLATLPLCCYLDRTFIFSEVEIPAASPGTLTSRESLRNLEESRQSLTNSPTLKFHRVRRLRSHFGRWSSGRLSLPLCSMNKAANNNY